jgi:hypothetical protein
MRVYIKQRYLVRSEEHTSDEVALFNVNSHMMAVVMKQHSKVSDEVVLVNVNSHMMAVMMIQHRKVSDEVGGAV